LPIRSAVAVDASTPIVQESGESVAACAPLAAIGRIRIAAVIHIECDVTSRRTAATCHGQ
jgi:hypothetical protein